MVQHVQSPFLTPSRPCNDDHIDHVDVAHIGPRVSIRWEGNFPGVLVEWADASQTRFIACVKANNDRLAQGFQALDWAAACAIVRGDQRSDHFELLGLGFTRATTGEGVYAYEARALSGETISVLERRESLEEWIHYLTGCEVFESADLIIDAANLPF